MVVSGGINRPVMHVVGAGLAGLAAAVRLAHKGHQVHLYESTGHAGGRCRSYHDETLGCRIDNGNHLLLSGNYTVQDYLTQIGSRSTLVAAAQAEFPFLDLRTGETWSVTPDKGRIPWFLLSSARRVPGTKLGEYLRGLSLAYCSADTTVRQALDKGGRLFDRFWEPLAVSVLNTEADTASARLLWPVIIETFAKGADACVPLVAEKGLSETFVDPALAYLEDKGAQIAFNQRLKELETKENSAQKLHFSSKSVDIAPQDKVVLALPPSVVAKLAPGWQVPDEFRPIVNGHFMVPEGASSVRFLGVIGGDIHWLFVRDNIASVTVSAANELANLPHDVVASRLWGDVCKALNLGSLPLGKHRIVTEKRATFAQIPDQITKRPDAKTDIDNLYLAGDWINNGLPATIEGTLRSGFLAADLASM